VSRSGAGVEGSCPPRRAPSFAYKALSRFPLHWSVFSLTPSLCALLRYSFVIYSFNLISMASTYCQSITHSSTEASVVTFSKLLPPYDASMFGCTARFDLSAPPMNGHQFQTSSAVSQLLPSARTADLPEDGQTLNSDDDGSALRQTDPGLFKAGKAGD
jgi:hypothetical protein